MLGIVNTVFNAAVLVTVIVLSVKTRRNIKKRNRE